MNEAFRQKRLDPEFVHRYSLIDVNNQRSWYMKDAERPLDVVMSLHSAGPPRARADKAIHSDEEVALINAQNKAARRILGGNMSTVLQGTKAPYGPSELTDEGRHQDALGNMARHFENIGVNPADVRVLNPDREYHNSPLKVVNIDEDTQEYEGGEPIKLEERGDFIYTRNPDIVLGVRPADCPIAFFYCKTTSPETGKEEDMWGGIHYAWRGPAYGQFEDTKKEFDKLGVDYSSLRVYITPGGQAETFSVDNWTPDDDQERPVPKEGNLFVGVEEEGGAEDKKYSFRIDTPYAVYEAFLGFGLDPKQVFLDTSDTSSLESGYGSHTRASNQKEDNVRDIVTVQLHAAA